MTVTLRRGEAADADAVGDICYRAFKAVAESHNFTPDLPSADLAITMLAWWNGPAESPATRRLSHSSATRSAKPTTG